MAGKEQAAKEKQPLALHPANTNAASSNKQTITTNAAMEAVVWALVADPRGGQRPRRASSSYADVRISPTATTHERVRTESQAHPSSHKAEQAMAAHASASDFGLPALPLPPLPSPNVSPDLAGSVPRFLSLSERLEELELVTVLMLVTAGMARVVGAPRCFVCG
jgi:hypothetical protein